VFNNLAIFCNNPDFLKTFINMQISLMCRSFDAMINVINLYYPKLN